MLFAWLAGLNLDVQGAYYDELHQAPASFRLIGKNPTLFTYAPLGIPLLNLPYSGAIKSNIYGLYLRYVSPQFTIYTWRSLGIALTALGLFFFYLIARRVLLLSAALLFAGLMLTDLAVLLMTRHDWGPVALSLSLRLVFVGLWISIASGEKGRFRYLAAGLIVGIAVYEKLSAFVLVAPLGLLLLASRKEGGRPWIMCGVGLATGLIPLVAINARSYWTTQSFISVSTVGALQPASGLNIFEYSKRYFSLALGGGAQDLILGELSSSYRPDIEAGLMLLAMTIVLIAAFVLRQDSPFLRIAGLMAASYLLVGVLVFLLPLPTDMHHWILGTPFQYTAIAMAIPALAGRFRESRGIAVLTVTCMVATAGLVANRLPNSVDAVNSLIAGKSSLRFSPVFTRLGQLAARHSQSAAFISADWGTATQLYCFTDGQDDVSYEPYWSGDPATAVITVANQTQKQTLYVVIAGLAPQFGEAAARIVSALRDSEDWEEVPPEREFASLVPLEIRKFVRISAR